MQFFNVVSRNLCETRTRKLWPRALKQILLLFLLLNIELRSDTYIHIYSYPHFIWRCQDNKSISLIVDLSWISICEFSLEKFLFFFFFLVDLQFRLHRDHIETRSNIANISIFTNKSYHSLRYNVACGEESMYDKIRNERKEKVIDERVMTSRRINRSIIYVIMYNTSCFYE